MLLLFTILVSSVFAGVGLWLLFASAETLLEGAVGIAKQRGISETTIGVVLIGFGTSLPEMITAIIAAFRNSSGLIVGNVVGSNIVNTLGVFGLALFLSPPGRKIQAKFGATALLLVTALFLLLALWGLISRLLGVLLLVCLGVYLRNTIRQDRTQPDAHTNAHTHTENTSTGTGKDVWGRIINRLLGVERFARHRHLTLALAGLLGVLVGAQLLIEGAVTLARIVGVSEAFIGLTLVAVGTSLPELATAWAARGRTEILLGNIIGSNIFNLLGVLGVGALIYPLLVPAQILEFDLWVLVAATLCFVWVVLLRPKLTRTAGAVFLVAYSLYILTLFSATFITPLLS